MIINNLVEVHSHILPGIDDGSPDVETSLKMIEKLKEQGAKAIILTPHYYSDSISYDDFVSMRNKAFDELNAALEPDSPRLIPAAEVYISKYLFNYDNIDSLCIGNTRYALIEHPFSCPFDTRTYERIITLIDDYSITPILPHIERYPALMENEELLDAYIKIGCLTQVNISSFANCKRSIKKRLIKYMNSGRIYLVGSDCHNLSSRSPDYEAGASEIVKKCGQDALDTLIENANVLVK